MNPWEEIMGHHEHRAEAPESIRVAVVSVSSTRTLQTDSAGQWIAKRAGREGHRVVAHQVVTDDRDAIREMVLHLLADATPQAMIVTGGTGITPQDVTIDAVRPLFSKELTAFGPIFAQLSFEQIDSAAILSRATAGVVGGCLVFCIPGSLKACQLACKALIFPELGHACGHVGAH
jgi:molybdenum cofactor biosynthesis protein B